MEKLNQYMRILMTKKIFKYELNNEKLNEQGQYIVEVPKSFTPLTAQLQHNALCVWAVVEDLPGEQLYKRRFDVVYTGADLLDIKTSLYIGTVKLWGGSIVVHVFDGGFV